MGATPTGDTGEHGSRVEALIDVDRQIGEVLVASVGRGRSNHRAIRLLMVSLIAEFILSCGVGAVALDNRRIAARTSNATTTLVANCKSGNESRALQRELWAFVLSQQTPTSAEQQASINRFRGFVSSTLADRDCSRIR